MEVAKSVTGLTKVKGSVSGSMYKMFGTAWMWRGREIYIGAKDMEDLRDLFTSMFPTKEFDSALVPEVVIAEAKSFKQPRTK